MAAEQKNPLAHQKMGDFYYYGLGTQVDQSKAAAYYRAASDLRDAQATFNLGYMHQHGIGLPRDLHLAKGYHHTPPPQSTPSPPPPPGSLPLLFASARGV
jgi:TPR repeat protein